MYLEIMCNYEGQEGLWGPDSRSGKSAAIQLRVVGSCPIRFRNSIKGIWYHRTCHAVYKFKMPIGK